MPNIRVRPDTGKLFLDFRHGGKRYREQTSMEDTKENRKKLERLAARIQRDMQLGTFDPGAYFPKAGFSTRSAIASATSAPPSTTATFTAAAIPPTPLFADFAQQWQAENAVQWRRSYQRTVADIVSVHLLPHFGQQEVGSISREQILIFRSSLAKAPGRKKETLSPRRINAVMNILRGILFEASDRYQFTCPFYNIKPLKVAKSDVQPFTLDEVKALLAAAREDFRDYYTVRFFTGLRTGEIDGLKWKYVDFSHRLILIRETLVAGEEDETKTIESNRDVQMSQIVFDALQRQFARTGPLKNWVFCNRQGQPLDHNNVTKRVWYPLLRYLGYTPRRPYQTRHTAATLWLAAGENPEWIARQMGHTSTEMLFKVYSRYVPNLTRRDGSAFERLLTTAMARVDVTQNLPAAAQGAQHD
ncbi:MULTISPECIES: site-specific integrase [unclassified Thiomonas]|jgi:integrase|uniref:site-specific integrase n=1 Tax=unclassified Thiomonas TaxID=2625466 RepID=UPI000A81C87F|nr:MULTISPECIES: site-specific integrase [unclassified Thiomonas]OZB69848.1 MAG: site-specific integrase [Thiomonas sp. 13-64-67]